MSMASATISIDPRDYTSKQWMAMFGSHKPAVLAFSIKMALVGW